MTYDNNGNLTSIVDAAGTTLYTWNARNQLTGISGPGVNASFVYDGLGRREKKTINSSLTEYLYDGLNPVQETSAATVLANILPGLGVDEFLARTDVPSGVTSSFLPDGLGSALALADSAGTVQTEYTYEPFGRTTLTGAANTSSYQYTGRENDTGLYYYRARYYSPQLHRFLSEDPAQIGGKEINLYTYAVNNPLRFVDPTGLFFERIWNNPQERSAHLSNAITMSQFIQYTKGKTLSDIQHAVDQGLARDSSAGGPPMHVRFVINPFNSSEVIDMRHFLVVGPQGEVAGLLIEISQWLSNNKSAFDAQDFLSNYLGKHFFKTYDPNRSLGDQLAEFFKIKKK